MSDFSELRPASRALARLTAGQRTSALLLFAELVESHSTKLIAASAKDLTENAAELSTASQARLSLDNEKVAQIVRGITLNNS